MMSRKFALAIVAASALAACGDDSKSHEQTHTPPDVDISNSLWTIGPIINGVSKSVNVPEHPTETPDGPAFSIPVNGSVHYVTMPTSSLSQATRIVLRYRVNLAPEAALHPVTEPTTGPALITLYFQRRGDNWSGAGAYETYRWWATFATQTLEPGEHTLEASLVDAPWTAIQTSNATTSPEQFNAAKRNAQSVGFTLGGGSGYGHGVAATVSPAVFTILEFKVS